MINEACFKFPEIVVPRCTNAPDSQNSYWKSQQRFVPFPIQSAGKNPSCSTIWTLSFISPRTELMPDPNKQSGAAVV